MKVLTGLVLFVTGTFLSGAINIKPTGDISPQLFFLGQVEGKNFYSDETQRTWNATKDYCDGLGFKMASINSVAQLNFLKSKFNDTLFNGSHWTAGRDALLPRQFSWDTTGGEVSTTVVTAFGVRVDNFQTCLTFDPKNSTPNFYFDNCSTVGFALCET